MYLYFPFKIINRPPFFSQIPKSLIAIVDGEITEDLKSAAASLKNRGIQIFVVAVGVNTPSSRHVSLASGRKFVHTVNSFDELGSLSARLAKDTCEGKIFLTDLSVTRHVTMTSYSRDNAQCVFYHVLTKIYDQ